MKNIMPTKNRLRKALKRAARATQAALIGLTFLSTSAQAIPLTWTLDIDPFAGPGGDIVTISGFFDFDRDLVLYSNINVNVSGSTTNGSLNGLYNLVNFGSPSGLILFKDFDGNGIDIGDGVVEFGFSTFPSLSNAGGTTDVSGSGFGFCSTIFSAGNCGFFPLGGRPGLITASTPGISPVPLPAALPLFGSSLAIMGIVGWYRKRRSVAT